MLANPLYPRYRVFKISPKRDPTQLPSERRQLLHSVNFIISYIFSIFTYSLCFTNILPHNLIDVLHSNSSIISILTPQLWVQYFQWVTYIGQLSIIANYIWKYGNKDTLLKLYDMTPYFITLNLIQSGLNLLSYSIPASYIVNIFGNIGIFSILIALFVKENVFQYGDVFTKFLSIDLPITLNYCSCLINILYIVNELIYYSEETLIYNSNVFSGIMIMLFILNLSILMSVRNVVQHFLYIILVVLYGGNTFNIDESTAINRKI